MRIAVYTLALTSGAGHDGLAIDRLLKAYFCPVFTAHGIVDTLAVCEDTVTSHDNGLVTFKCYDDFLRSRHSETVAATIQEYGDLNHTFTMVQKIVRVMNASGGMIVLSNYYN